MQLFAQERRYEYRSRTVHNETIQLFWPDGLQKIFLEFPQVYLALGVITASVLQPQVYHT